MHFHEFARKIIMKPKRCQAGPSQSNTDELAHFYTGEFPCVRHRTKGVTTFVTPFSWFTDL